MSARPLTREQRAEIARRYRDGERPRDLGREYEISASTLQNIRRAHGLVSQQADRELDLPPIERLVKRFTEAYPDNARKRWMERHLREWWQGRKTE